MSDMSELIEAASHWQCDRCGVWWMFENHQAGVCPTCAPLPEPGEFSEGRANNVMRYGPTMTPAEKRRCYVCDHMKPLVRSMADRVPFVCIVCTGTKL
jgi:hypothetical protein